jgi:hypothetical protein
VTAANAIVQRLSQFPDETPSAYFDLALKSRGVLDIAFTHAHVPAGTFSFTKNYEAASPHSVLHLNTADIDYYQNGIPGATRSVDATVQWLLRIRSEFGFRATRVVGASMAGYAAILYGDRIGADFVCAVSPVLDWSHVFLGNVADIIDLHAEIARISRRATLMFGAFDVVDYKDMTRCLNAGLRVADLAIVGNIHGSANSLNLGRLLASGAEVTKEELMLNPYDIRVDASMIRALGGLELFRLTEGSTHATEVLEQAAVIDPLNPDFRFRRAMLLGMLGRAQEAADAMRDAIVIGRYQIDRFGADILGMMGEYEKRVVKEYAWNLSYSEMRPLLELVREAERTVHLSRARDLVPAAG